MIIDIFNHFMPKPYLDRLAALIPGHVATTAFPRLKTLVDVDARLKLLDEFGDFAQVLSLANPPLELVAGPDVTPDLARSFGLGWAHGFIVTGTDPGSSAAAVLRSGDIILRFGELEPVDTRALLRDSADEVARSAWRAAVVLVPKVSTGVQH